MKSPKWIYIILLLFIVCFAGFVFKQNFQIGERIQDVFLKYNIQSTSFQYETAAPALFDNGIIFYKAQIPALSIKHKIDKVIFTEMDNQIDIQFIGFTIDVIDSLRHSENVHIIPVLNEYIPFEDALKKPLQTLAVMGIDKIKLNASMQFEPFKNIFQIKGKIAMPFLADIDYSIVMNKMNDSNHNPVYALFGIMKQAGFKIKDRGAFKRYQEYVSDRGIYNENKTSYDLSKKIYQMDLQELKTPLLLTPLYETE